MGRDSPGGTLPRQGPLLQGRAKLLVMEPCVAQPAARSWQHHSPLAWVRCSVPKRAALALPLLGATVPVPVQGDQRDALDVPPGKSLVPCRWVQRQTGCSVLGALPSPGMGAGGQPGQRRTLLSQGCILGTRLECCCHTGPHSD